MMSILRCDRLAILIVALFIPMLAHASTDTNKATVRQALAALEAGDVARINQLFDPKGLIHGAKGDTVQGGPATTLAQACPMCARLNGRQIQVSLIMAEDDLVTVRSKWSGRYSGDFLGKKVADRLVSFTYTNIYRVRDGRIVENWYAVNPVEIADHLGVTLRAQ